MVATFSVPGDPVPKARPRVFWDAKAGRYRAASTRKTSEAEKRIAENFWVRYPRHKPLTGRVKLVLRFYVSHRRRVDADNLEKTVKDALNKLAYEDDWQVDTTVVSVERGVPDPRTEVEVWTMPGDPVEARRRRLDSIAMKSLAATNAALSSIREQRASQAGRQPPAHYRSSSSAKRVKPD